MTIGTAGCGGFDEPGVEHLARDAVRDLPRLGDDLASERAAQP